MPSAACNVGNLPFGVNAVTATAAARHAAAMAYPRFSMVLLLISFLLRRSERREKAREFVSLVFSPLLRYPGGKICEKWRRQHTRTHARREPREQRADDVCSKSRSPKKRARGQERRRSFQSNSGQPGATRQWRTRSTRIGVVVVR